MRELIITTIDTMEIYRKLLNEGAISMETYRALLGNLLIISEECGLRVPTIFLALVAGQRNKLHLAQNGETDSH